MTPKILELKRLLKNIYISGLFVALCAVITPEISNAQTVQNGSLNGGPVGNNLIGPNCPSWTVCGFSPDFCNVGFPAYNGNSQVAVSPSPDGEPWLGMAAVGAGECAQTTITGLTVGNQYTLCFWGACFGTNALFNSSPSNPEICVGGTCQTFVIPMAANTWNLYTMTFTAANATETLSCTLTGDDSYCSLDGFQVVIPGATATWTDPSPLCDTDPPINLDALVTGTPGGVWSGAGVTGNTFDPSGGSQSVTYTVNPNTCNEVSQTINVTVQVCATCDPAWTTTTACSTDPVINLDALITGDAGGTWSGTGVTGNIFDPASGTQSVTYTAPGGCDSIQTITVTPTGVATWTPPVGVCSNSPVVDLNTLITGTPGGTWSGTGVTGNTFDPSGGTQSITYTVGTVPCQDVSTQNIDVTPALDPSWNSPGTICETGGTIDLNTLITGDVGGTWSGTGVTGNTFDPAGLSGPISVTYTIGAAPCTGTDQQDITVTPDVDPTWVAPTTLCDTDGPFDLNSTITGTTGGTWSGLGVSGSMFDPAAGSQNVTYTVGTAPCDEMLTLLIDVGVTPDPSWTIFTACLNDPAVDLDTTVTGTPGGTWSGTGVTGNMYSPSMGPQSVTYTVVNGSCSADLTQTITGLNPNISITGTNVSCFGLADGTLDVTTTGGSGNYTYNWNTTPPQTTATVSNVPAGVYTVLVTDTDANCVNIDSIEIVEPDSIVINLAGVNACYPSLGTAVATVTGGVGGFTYVWNDTINTTENAFGLDSGWATVTVTDGNGCTETDSVLINIYPAPNMTITADTTIEYGDFAQLYASGGVSFVWDPSSYLDCDDCPNPVAAPLDDTQYCVTMVDTNGCVADTCVTVTVVIVCGEVFVPSAFSPNDDGENDELCVYTDCWDNLTFKIYNRWGEVVYTTSNENICWDGTWKGKELNPAVFVYTLDGNLLNGQSVNLKGNISLIR